MEKWKNRCLRLINWRPGTGLIACGAVAALLLLLVPLVRISFCSTPWYDDYAYAKFTRNFILTYGMNLKSVLEGVLYCVKTEWYAYQGTFSSVFFMALMPGLWGDDKYFLGPLFLIGLLVFATMVLMRVIIVDIFGGDKKSCLFLQTASAIMLVELMYNAQQGFYWFNGGVHYVGMHSFCMLLVAGCIRLLTAKKTVAKALLMLWTVLGAVLVGGSNYVTSLQAAVLLVSIVGTVCVFDKNRRKVLLLIPAMLTYAVCFYLNVSAPGNAVRASAYVGWGLDPVHAILQSFVEAAKQAGRYTEWMGLALLVLMAPVIWQMVGKCTFRFRLPGLLLAWSVCMYATGFTTSLFTLGNAGLARVWNVARMTYQVLLIVNEIYWLGWLRGSLEKKGKQVFDGRVSWLFYPAVGCAMLAVFALNPHRETWYSSYSAYHYVHTGEAYNYYQEYLDRMAYIQEPGGEKVVRPYGFRPWLISVGELSDDPTNEANRALADYYHKDAVICTWE